MVVRRRTRWSCEERTRWSCEGEQDGRAKENKMVKRRRTRWSCEGEQDGRAKESKMVVFTHRQLRIVTTL